MATEPSKAAAYQKFYSALHDLFMRSGCDFWNECDAPESLATIAVKIQKAALRSSPQTGSGMKCAIYSQVPPYRMRCEPCLAAGRCLEFDKAPQTGGGDAGERFDAAQIAQRIAAAMYPAPSDTARRDILCEMLANELEDVAETIIMLRTLVVDTQKIISDGQEDARRGGGGDAGERAREHASAVLYRVTEHLAKTGEWAEEDIAALRAGLAMLDSREADLRSSHREGAEAMREDAAIYHDKRRELVSRSSAYQEAWHKMAANDIRALPIPGKTDAG